MLKGRWRRVLVVGAGAGVDVRRGSGDGRMLRRAKQRQHGWAVMIGIGEPRRYSIRYIYIDDKEAV